MKKIFTLLFLLGVYVAASMAQTYTVMEMKGRIDSLDNRGQIQSFIMLKQKLAPSTQIRVNENSFIRLVDEEARTMFFLKDAAEGSISDLITAEQCTITKLAESYYRFLKKKMMRMPDICKNDRYMNRHCHTTRGDTLFTDSIVSDTIIHVTLRKGVLHRDTIIKDSVISDTIVRPNMARDTIVAASRNNAALRPRQE